MCPLQQSCATQSGLLHAEVREGSDSFLQFQVMRIGNPNTEILESMSLWHKLFLSRIVARFGYTSVSKLL